MIEIKTDNTVSKVYCNGEIAGSEFMEEAAFLRIDNEVQNRRHRIIPVLLYDYLHDNTNYYRRTSVAKLKRMLDLDYGIEVSDKAICRMLGRLEVFGIVVERFSGTYYDKSADMRNIA